MAIELGLIEGYYGTPWSWAEREATIAFLADHGYGFHIYAPKADPYLRRRWQEDHPAEMTQGLTALSAHCRALGVRFGVGLSPFEIYRDFNSEAKAAMARKLAALDAIGIDDLAILFDDMRGDLPGLAASQTRILHWIAERSGAGRIITCPSYYTDDPVLDRVFGQRPPDYLEDLGRDLDPAIGVFWTGEEVCSREYSPAHLGRVSEQLRRKPILWDNYPVNDGPVMSMHLHLRAMTGRPASLAPHLTAHAVNPALQPVLTRIPALTLTESYVRGEAYQYGQAFGRAAAAVMGPELAAVLRGQLLTLQDRGLDRLDEGMRERLRNRWAEVDHPAAREIIAWLDGAWLITAHEIETQ